MPVDRDISKIEAERLRSVFEQAPLTLSVTVLNAMLTAGVLAPAGYRGVPALWTGAIGAVSLLRWIGGRIFLARGHAHTHLTRWSAFSIAGSLVTGVLWGAGATVVFPDSEFHQLFLALVIGGMCAGASTVNAAHLPSVMAFILPATVPLAGSFLAGGPAWRVAALMIIIFVASLSLIGVCAHRAFGARVLLRLALGREQQKLSEANERLSKEVAQRHSIEATLQQAQKMEAIGHLTGGLAHDFNNLLQVIIGNMSLIRRVAGGDARIMGYAAMAEQAAKQGAELTGSLLAFARRQSLTTERVDVNRLLRAFEPILLRTLNPNIQLEIVLMPELPVCCADPAHFQSAVLNLVINARDAMPNGGRLTISTGMATLEPDDLIGNPDASPGDFVSMSVRDSGVGMSDEVVARVFEPFFTTKEAGKGTGLGLSQVYGFARQSGGHVSLASKPGEGTSATLWLPVAPADVQARGTETVSDGQ